VRPHRLRVTAFGAFAGTETVVFDELDGLFLLHGETGAGKTTLLDAIAFALYGRVPGERGTARRLRSDHAAPGTATEVELEATLGARRLRITRRPEQERQKKSGAGRTREQASVRVEERAPDGGWAARSTRVGEADREIAELMGMSAEQFFQVVLLPQGQFAQFLHAKAQEKEALLQQLFGTGRFSRVEDWLAERRRATDKEVAAAREDVNRLLARIAQAAGTDVPEEWVAAPAAEPPAVPGAGAMTDEPVAQAAWQSAWATGLAAAAAAERDTAAGLVEARKSELNAALAGQREAERLAGRQRRRRDALDRQRELEAAVPEIARLRAAAEARAGAGAGAEALRAAGQERQAQAGRLEALRAVARQAAAEDQTALAARDRATKLTSDIDRAGAEAALRQADRALAERARDTASQAAAALPAAQARAGIARRAAADAAALVTEHARRGELREAHLAARERHVAAQGEALRVRGARIDGMRAELAAGMTDGSPCPVCGSLDHPDPVDAASFPPVSREAEEAAFRLAGDAAQAANQAGQQVAAAGALLGELARRLSDAGYPVQGPARPRPGAEAGDVAVPDAAIANLAALDERELTAVAAAAQADAERLEAEATRLADAAAQLGELQRELADLDEAIAADRAGLAELAEQRTAARAEARAADARAADRRAELAAQLDGEDLEDAIGAAAVLAEALLTAAALADLLNDPDLAVPLSPPAPAAEAAGAVDAAQQALDQANEAYGAARHRTEQLAGLLPGLDDALGVLAPLTDDADRIRQLADLAEGRGANQYKMTLSSFVLAARLEEVAAAASERLLSMTAGRYCLVHSDARKGNAKAGLSLLACDAWTGIDRDTATLSGGETFLASLALALGLADVVTAESAGTPMEALFIDEGFGTLDEETLDEVMNVLDGLRAGGRIVGIVSHVTELRQRVPAQVHVRKSRSGSHVETIAG
jgi:exonuclease SbcC